MAWGRAGRAGPAPGSVIIVSAASHRGDATRMTAMNRKMLIGLTVMALLAVASSAFLARESPIIEVRHCFVQAVDERTDRPINVSVTTRFPSGAKAGPVTPCVLRIHPTGLVMMSWKANRGDPDPFVLGADGYEDSGIPAGMIYATSGHMSLGGVAPGVVKMKPLPSGDASGRTTDERSSAPANYAKLHLDLSREDAIGLMGQPNAPAGLLHEDDGQLAWLVDRTVQKSGMTAITLAVVVFQNGKISSLRLERALIGAGGG